MAPYNCCTDTVQECDEGLPPRSASPSSRSGRREGAQAPSWVEWSRLSLMSALKAHVKGGRPVLDEPTELPEGEVVELVPLDELLAGGGDYLDDEERERLHESLRESIRQLKAGETVDAATALAELRAHR